MPYLFHLTRFCRVELLTYAFCILYYPAALRRSRRRVRSVVTTELPFLISKEFENSQENDPHAMKISAGLPPSKTADLHRARWTALFDHMDEALSEEEKQLVSA